MHSIAQEAHRGPSEAIQKGELWIKFILRNQVKSIILVTEGIINRGAVWEGAEGFEQEEET